MQSVSAKVHEFTALMNSPTYEKNLSVSHQYQCRFDSLGTVMTGEAFQKRNWPLKIQFQGMFPTYPGGGEYMGKYMGSLLESFVGKQC